VAPCRKRSRSVSGTIGRCSRASSDAVTPRVPESCGPVRGHRYAAGCEGPKAQSVPTKKAARTARRPNSLANLVHVANLVQVYVPLLTHQTGERCKHWRWICSRSAEMSPGLPMAWRASQYQGRPFRAKMAERWWELGLLAMHAARIRRRGNPWQRKA
jgi:hypothetical protein